MRTARHRKHGPCGGRRSPNFRGTSARAPLGPLSAPSSGALGAARREPAGRRGRPGGAGRPQDRQPGAAGEADVHPHELGGQVRLVLIEPDDPLQREQHAQHRQRALHRRGRRAPAREPPHEPTAARLNTNAISAWRWITKSIVPRPSKLRRLIFWPGEPPACGPAAVAAVPGEDRQRTRAPRAQRSARDERAVGRWRGRTLAAALRPDGSCDRPPDEHHRGDQDQHRQREVAHHPAVVERALDGEAAEHGLADDAQRQQRCQPHQVAPVGAPAQRRQPRERPRRSTPAR